MWKFLLALLALAGCSIATTLSSKDAAATFKLIGAEGEDCAATLQHLPSSDGFTFRSVQAGSSNCTETPETRSRDDAKDSVGSYETGYTIIRAATDIEQYLLAVDKKPRKCGATTYAPGTVTALLRPDRHVTVAPGLQLPPGLWAILANPSKSGLCLYAGEETMSAASEDVKNVTNPVRRDDAVCFPGDAQVLLADGTYVEMAQLDVGHVVATGGEASRVYMFTHRERDVQYRFVRLHTRLPRPLVLTAGHRLYANDVLVAADEVRVGDLLRAVDGRSLYVVKVDEVFGNGLYNPQTVQGDIVVDGVVVSTFTSTVETRTAHALLTPLRALYSCTRTSFSTLEGNSPVARWLRGWRRRS